jgi:GT2 family glycosyltransferase
VTSFEGNSNGQRVTEVPAIGLAITQPTFRDQPESSKLPYTWSTLSQPISSLKVLDRYACGVSAIVISFNTCKLLRECLQSLQDECAELPDGVTAEVWVVDNASTDGSDEMVEREFADARTPVRLIRSKVNLGFGGANNLAMEQAQGRYIVLLNSDAFLHPGALRRAVEHMDASPQTGFGGAKLVGRDGELQPSGRLFHTILRDAIVFTGLAAKYPRSRIFGAPDRTWADPDVAAEVDWVPGAFMIMRREALEKTGLFDPRFFLYYEETDLCRRVKAAGYRVSYWPDVVVTHIGGESGKQLRSLTASKSASRVELWRMRSTLLYYRKHHGGQAHLAMWLEWVLYSVRQWRNQGSSDPDRRERAKESGLLAGLMRQAWQETQGGRVSPPQPW